MLNDEIEQKINYIKGSKIKKIANIRLRTEFKIKKK
jgi:hypothetical protein